MKLCIGSPLCLLVVVLLAACGGRGAPPAPPGEGVSPASGTAGVPVGGGPSGSTVSTTVPVGSGVSDVTGTTLVRLQVPAMERVDPVVEEVSGGGFMSVSAGWGYSCGLRVDRSVECWESRSDWWGRTERMLDTRSSSDPSDWAPPGGEFVMVDAGWEYACALRSTGGVECWGRNPVVALEPPRGEFTTVSAGVEHACALRSDGEVECWGVSPRRKGALVLPEGPFAAISAASRGYLCGLRPGGEVECWGGGFEEGSEAPFDEGAEPPEGVFEWISTDGGGNMCGIRQGGWAECWAEAAPEKFNSPPPGEFSMASSGRYACGLRPSGEVECWYQWAEEGQAAAAPEGNFTWVSVRNSFACGLPVGGGVVCWDVPAEEGSPRRVREGEFKALSLGEYHDCGLRVDGEVECWWGDNEFGEASPPGGRFESVSASDGYSCGLRPSGEVECWGSDEFGKSSPPAGVFTQITTSRDFACGLRPDGEVECWGGRASLRRQSKVVPPRERLVSVDAGWAGWSNTDSPTSSVRSGGRMDWGYSCGLRADGTPLCWGDGGQIGGGYSILSPPGGVFEKIEVGMWRACGLRPGGSVECWGSIGVAGEDGWTYADGSIVYEADPPGGGGFVDVELGAWHACGLRPDGGVYCWNWRRDVRDTDYTLDGPYESISVGFSHTCGLRPDGGIDCWWLTSKDAPPSRSGVLESE